MLTTLKMRLTQLAFAVLVSGLCLMLVAAFSVPAQAADDGVPNVTSEVCADAEGQEALDAEAAACILRLRQPMQDTASVFGGPLRLSQTFIAPKTERVCVVRALIIKNVPNNDPLVMQVQTLGGAVLDSAVVAAGPLPIGVPVWVTFNMNCDGGVLVNGNQYRLELFAPQSPTPSYFRWLRHTASVIPGQAFQRVFPGGPAAIAPAGTDFTFLLYMCS